MQKCICHSFMRRAIELAVETADEVSALAVDARDNLAMGTANGPTPRGPYGLAVQLWLLSSHFRMSSVSLGEGRDSPNNLIPQFSICGRQAVYVVLLLACLEEVEGLQTKRKQIHIARVDEHSESENVPTY